ncbi:hypothetical protein ANO14919_084700 [Xylariales sp. No.14919]|nr:hypothetical protein ANO14919_084700 [Xylariales sp. No.14919]
MSRESSLSKDETEPKVSPEDECRLGDVTNWEGEGSLCATISRENSSFEEDAELVVSLEDEQRLSAVIG